MRSYSVPGAYRAVLEAAVNEAVSRIRRDIDRRAQGLEPLVADFMISQSPAPDEVLVMGASTEPILKLHPAASTVKEGHAGKLRRPA